MMDIPMTARDYLGQAYRLDQRINSKLEQVERLRALARRTTVAFGGERVTHSRNVSAMEDAVLRLMKAEEVLNREIDRFVDIKQEIQQTIDMVADPDCRLLMEFRYLAMKRWSDVAGEMGICRTYANRIHEKALAMVDTVLRTRSVLKDEKSKVRP